MEDFNKIKNDSVLSFSPMLTLPLAYFIFFKLHLLSLQIFLLLFYELISSAWFLCSGSLQYARLCSKYCVHVDPLIFTATLLG